MVEQANSKNRGGCRLSGNNSPASATAAARQPIAAACRWVRGYEATLGTWRSSTQQMGVAAATDTHHHVVALSPGSASRLSKSSQAQHGQLHQQGRPGSTRPGLCPGRQHHADHPLSIPVPSTHTGGHTGWPAAIPIWRSSSALQQLQKRRHPRVLPVPEAGPRPAQTLPAHSPHLLPRAASALSAVPAAAGEPL